MSDTKIKVGLFFIEENHRQAEGLCEWFDGDAELVAEFVHLGSTESESDVLVAILTNESISEASFLKKLDFFYEKKVRILPVILDAGINFLNIPESINSIQWIELWDPDTRDERIERMVKAMKTDYSHLERFRHYARLAEDWFLHAEKADRLLRGQALLDSERWLRGAADSFPRPTQQIRAFVVQGRIQSDALKARNERVLRLFWGLIASAAIICLIFAGFIFRDALRIQKAEERALLRKEQSQDLIEYMVDALDEPLLEMNQSELLADIVQEAESYLEGAAIDTESASDQVFRERMTAQIAQVRERLDALPEDAEELATENAE